MKRTKGGLPGRNTGPDQTKVTVHSYGAFHAKTRLMETSNSSLLTFAGVDCELGVAAQVLCLFPDRLAPDLVACNLDNRTRVGFGKLRVNDREM